MALIRRRENKPLRTKILESRTQKCGMRHTIFSVNGDEYTGEWQDNMRHGRGTQVWKKTGAIYNGEWKYGKPDGYGTYIIPLPGTKKYIVKYCGEWKNGKRHGYGICFFNSLDVYEGDWKENRRCGWGRMSTAKETYEGEWMKEKHGRGVIYLANGNWYEGCWREGKKDGEGKFFFAVKGRLYKGLWVDNIAKRGVLFETRTAETPTPIVHPNPQRHLEEIEKVLREAHFSIRLHCEKGSCDIRQGKHSVCDIVSINIDQDKMEDKMFLTQTSFVPPEKSK